MSESKEDNVSRDYFFVELIKANCRGEGDSVNVDVLYQLLQSSDVPEWSKWVEARDGNFLQYFIGKSDTYETVESEKGEYGIRLRVAKTPLDQVRSPRLPVRKNLIPFESSSEEEGEEEDEEGEEEKEEEEIAKKSSSKRKEEVKKKKSSILGKLVKMWKKTWKKEEEMVKSPLSPKVPKIPDMGKTKECPVCLDDVIIPKFHTFFNCGHDSVCKECCMSHVEQCIMTRKIPIPCPDAQCTKEVNQYDLNWLLKEKEGLMMNYFKFSVDIAIGTTKDMHHCLTTDCSYAFWNEDKDTKYFHCPSCRKEYCLQCRVSWHKGVTCDKFVDSMKEDEFKKLCNQNQWKECPKCGAIVAKISGCNHITCICKHEFCYVCRSEWESDEECCTSDEEDSDEDDSDWDESDDDSDSD